MSAQSYADFQARNIDEYNKGGEYNTIYNSYSNRSPSTAVVIIVIVIIIILFVILFYFLIRARKTTTTTSSTTTGCILNNICKGATPVCNTGTDKCVACLVPSDCPIGSPVCNPDNTCTQCNVDGDCPSGVHICNTTNHTCVACMAPGDCPTNIPVCTTNNTCVQCLANTDCTTGAHQCNTTTNTCIECNVAGDCTSPAVCNSHTCCDLTGPTIETIIPTTSGDSSIAIYYTFTQPPTGATLTVSLYTVPSNGTPIYTTTIPATGSVILTESGMNMPIKYLFPGAYYSAQLQINYVCGGSNVSTNVTHSNNIYMLNCNDTSSVQNNGVYNSSGNPLYYNYAGMIILFLNNTSTFNIAVTVNGSPGVHPNLAQRWYPNIATMNENPTVGGPCPCYQFAEVPYYGAVGTTCYVNYYVIGSSGHCISNAPITGEVAFTRGF